MTEKSRKTAVRNILYAAVLAVITAATCFAAVRQHTSLFFSSGNNTPASAAFFVSVFVLFIFSEPAVGAGIAIAVNIAAAVFCTDHLFAGLPAVIFLIMIFSENRHKRNTTLFTAAAVVESGLFIASLTAAMLRRRADTDFQGSEMRSIPCAVFLCCIAAFFLYRLRITDKNKTEKKNTGKKKTKDSGTDRQKTVWLLGALTALSSAVYMYSVLAAYEAKAYVGIWAVTVFFTELKNRGWLLPGMKIRKDDEK